MDRIERYSKIRRWLGRPFEQNPSPDEILSQMLVEEQSFLNRLSNTGQPWSLIPHTLQAQAGKSEYLINTIDGEPGKVFFVYRVTNHSQAAFLPIEFDNFNQIESGKLPPGVNTHLLAVERMSFFRKYGQAQEIKAVIQPVPQESLTYKIYFQTGQIDRLNATWESTSVLSECSDYLDLKAAIALLPYAFWRDDKSPENQKYNSERRKELGTGLLFQLQQQTPIVEKYIENINNPTAFEMDYWDEE